MRQHHGHVSRRTRLLAGVLLAVCFCLNWSPSAVAASPACSDPTFGTVASITLPSVYVSPGIPVGTLLGNPSAATVHFSCANETSAYSTVTIEAGNLASLDPTNTMGGGSIMFATNLAGVAVQLTATPNPADAGANGPAGSPGWELNSKSNTLASVAATFTAQLIKTGPIAPGRTRSINLFQLTNYSFRQAASAPYYVTVTLNPVSVTLSTCTVNMASPNFTVTLPNISTNALTGPGTVAGTTPFNLSYTCPSGWMLSMTMNTPSASLQQGVISSTTSGGCTSRANNVGLRLLQGNQQAVAFNNPQPIGASPNGSLTIPYFVQYYQTGSPVGAGGVCGIATYTMTYQ